MFNFNENIFNYGFNFIPKYNIQTDFIFIWQEVFLSNFPIPSYVIKLIDIKLFIILLLAVLLHIRVYGPKIYNDIPSFI